jgi:hypothetical protein
MNEDEWQPYPHPVYDFGLSDVELDALMAIQAPTEREIAAGIVDEAELAARGRWGGGPTPRRWTPLFQGRAESHRKRLSR